MPNGRQGKERDDPDVVKEIVVETPVGKLAAYGIRISDIIAVGLAAGLSAVFFIVHAHNVEAKEYSAAMSAALYEQSKALRALTRAQILTTCVMAMPMERRERELREQTSFCRRMADLP
jgi:hypothetical protein